MLIFFCALLAIGWLATFLTAFCPLRASHRRRMRRECEELESGSWRSMQGP